MKTKTVILLLSTIILFSCKKEGCTDKDSTNYNSEAKEDNGTCHYEGTLMFYTGLSNTGNIEIFINGSSVGVLTNYVTSGEPNCGESGTITITKDLGTVKTAGYSITATAQSGATWSATVNAVANTCIKTKLQ